MAVEQFFYSGQIRKYLMQFMRGISGFQVRLSTNSLGVESYQQVPVIYGDSSRQVAQILRGNSENTTLTVPAMSVYINEFTFDRDRVLNPTHVSTLYLKERKYDEDLGEYTTEQGDSFSVERLMPVPYTLGLKLDIWASNTDQKLQIVEQLSGLFNVALEIQSTDSYIDWTSLTAIFLENTSWTSRTVPMGAEDMIDVFTYTFKLPIWITGPAKIKKQSIIQKIITNIYDEDGNYDISIIDASNPSFMARQVITPMNAQIVYLGSKLELLLETSGIAPNWKTLIDLYGVLTPGVTQVRLWQEGSQSEIIGTVDYDPADNAMLLFTPIGDTMPTNNLASVDRIIDPSNMKLDASVLTPDLNARFLILADIGAAGNVDGAVAWKGADLQDLVAPANSIIQYNGAHWDVSFDPDGVTDIKYVTNLTSGIQYKFIDNIWVKSVEGQYSNGNWRIVL